MEKSDFFWLFSAGGVRFKLTAAAVFLLCNECKALLQDIVLQYLFNECLRDCMKMIRQLSFFVNGNVFSL